jgi:hypothetical protein
VAVVYEDYEPDLWAAKRKASPALPGNQVLQLRNVLEAIGNVDSDPPASLKLLKGTFQSLTGQALDISRWEDSLYERLSGNEVAYQIADALMRPRSLGDLVEDLAKRLGREVPEEEVLIWLALGAAAQREGRALLRPVVHAFVRGVAGGVVTFPLSATSARLALSAEEVGPDSQGLFRLPLMTCTTCGQHYFVHHVRDFTFTDRAPGGGEAVENRVIWRPLEEQLGGDRVVLLDRLVVDATDDDDDDDGAPPPQPQLRAPPRNSVPLYFCRYCGTMHAARIVQCDGCLDRGTHWRLQPSHKPSPSRKCHKLGVPLKHCWLDIAHRGSRSARPRRRADEHQRRLCELLGIRNWWRWCLFWSVRRKLNPVQSVIFRLRTGNLGRRLRKCSERRTCLR